MATRAGPRSAPGHGRPWLQPAAKEREETPAGQRMEGGAMWLHLAVSGLGIHLRRSSVGGGDARVIGGDRARRDGESRDWRRARG